MLLNPNCKYRGERQTIRKLRVKSSWLVFFESTLRLVEAVQLPRFIVRSWQTTTPRATIPTPRPTSVEMWVSQLSDWLKCWTLNVAGSVQEAAEWGDSVQQPLPHHRPGGDQGEQLQYKTTQYQVRFSPLLYRNKSNMKFSHLKLILLTKVLITYLVSAQSSG